MTKPTEETYLCGAYETWGWHYIGSIHLLITDKKSYFFKEEFKSFFNIYIMIGAQTRLNRYFSVDSEFVNSFNKELILINY